MTTEEQLDKLTVVVASLASSVVAHDDQIEKLITIVEKQSASFADLERQWQAYINTLSRQ
jgi:hypothetical protein